MLLDSDPKPLQHRSSDEEDTPETFITADTAAPRLGGVSKVPGTSIPKSAPAARKVSASGGGFEKLLGSEFPVLLTYIYTSRPGAAPVRKKATAKRPVSGAAQRLFGMSLES